MIRLAVRRRSLAALVACAAVVPALVLPSAVAHAAWSTSGSGTAAGGAQVMPTGSQPSTRVSGTVVPVAWAAVTLPGGQPVGGYLVDRTNAATGLVVAAGTGCAGVITVTSCVENPAPAGTWIYTDIPVLASWSGPTSPGSSPVTVP